MSNSIGPRGPSVRNIQTPATAPAEESTSVDIGAPGKREESAASPTYKAMGAAAQKQGRETASVNELRGDLRRQELNGKLALNDSNVEKAKTTPIADKAKTPTNADKPKKDPKESLATIDRYRNAVKDSNAHKKALNTLEGLLKKAPDSMKPSIQKAIDLEKAKLMDADRRREIYKQPAMKELKEWQEEAKKGLENIRG